MPLSRARRAVPAVVAGLALTLASAGCGTGSGAAGATEGAVVTSFYPIQYATQQITGGSVPVTVLTKPGAEPHDLELAPQDIAAMTKARLVVYADGFQPAVDEAVADVQPPSVLDVADAARLTLASDEAGHEGETAAGPDGHGHAGSDPHFWLDPQRYAAVARAIGARLAHDDPGHAAAYTKNTDAFVARLTTLDDELRSGLASCRSPVLVTSHAAFGYLAQRYGLEQHGITGVSPEAEPTASGLKEISDLVRSRGVTTIFQETLVEPHFADTVAGSAGATVATLDPVEGITGASAGRDYFEVMRSNLASLEKGLGCS